MPEHPNPRELRDDLLQNGEVLAPEILARVSAQASDVAAGPRQTRDEPGLHGIRREDHNNRYRFGCLPGGRDVNAGTGDDHIHPQAYQLSGNFRQPVHVAVRVPSLEDHVASFDVPEIAQPFAERAEQRRHGLA